jgi:GNAT superfamily N-acetyltransferase
VLLRAGEGPALAAATLNLYAPDHARIQAVVSAPDRRRCGHATALVSELHGMLSEAGLSRALAVLLEDPPQTQPEARAAQSEARTARDALLRRRLGYRDLPIEALVELRRDSSDYHPQLLGTARLLVRPLEVRSGGRDAS